MQEKRVLGDSDPHRQRGDREIGACRFGGRVGQVETEDDWVHDGEILSGFQASNGEGWGVGEERAKSADGDYTMKSTKTRQQDAQ